MVIPSIVKQRAFMRDTAGRRAELKGEVGDANEDWDFNGMVYANDMAASGVGNKLKEVQRLCEDEGEAVLTFVIEVIELSREVIETKRDKGKLVGLISDLERELVDVPSLKRLACVSLELMSVGIKTLEVQVKDADAKYAKVVDETAQTKEKSPFSYYFVGVMLKAKNDCFAQLEKNCVYNVAGDKDVLADQLGTYDAIGSQLKERKEALR